MRMFSVAVSVGITNHEHGSAEIIITTENRLVMTHSTPRMDVNIDMGAASKRRINFIIECLERIRLHASDD